MNYKDITIKMPESQDNFILVYIELNGKGLSSYIKYNPETTQESLDSSFMRLSHSTMRTINKTKGTIKN